MTQPRIKTGKSEPRIEIGRNDPCRIETGRSYPRTELGKELHTFHTSKGMVQVLSKEGTTDIIDCSKE